MLPKRATLALVITAVALALLLNFKTPAATTPTSLLAAADTAVTSTTAATAGAVAAATGSAANSVGLKAGTYTGSAVSFRYGTVQLQVTVAGGKITNVQILQYPSSDPHSSQIAQTALPTLISETLKAQSAQVGSVSGATFTSQGYLSSLQSALDQAHA